MHNSQGAANWDKAVQFAHMLCANVRADENDGGSAQLSAMEACLAQLATCCRLKDKNGRVRALTLMDAMLAGLQVCCTLVWVGRKDSQFYQELVLAARVGGVQPVWLQEAQSGAWPRIVIYVLEFAPSWSTLTHLQRVTAQAHAANSSRAHDAHHPRQPTWRWTRSCCRH
jgi:hypothetical protein